MILEELQRRNYAEITTRRYVRIVEDFSRHFHCSPDRLGPRHIREYQAELCQKRKLSPGTVTQRLAALRFLYIKTLKKGWSIAETQLAAYAPSIAFFGCLKSARLIGASATAAVPYQVWASWAKPGRWIWAKRKKILPFSKGIRASR
jgi:hypothetical protein